MAEIDPTYRTFEVPGVGHLYSWGSPKDPIVVLLHGFMQSGLSWAALAEEFAQNHWVLAPDLLGFGKTGLGVSDDLSLESYADQVKRLIQWAKAEVGENQAKPLVIVGYSLGGRVAATFACHYPEMLDALVLESAGLGPENEEERAGRAQKTASMLQRLDASVAADPENPLVAFVSWWETLPLFASQAALPQALQQVMRQERLNNNPKALHLNLSQAGQQHMPNMRPLLSSLNKPLLYIVGELDVAYTKVARSLQAAQTETTKAANANPHDQHPLQVMAMPGAGHNVHAERPEAYVHLLESFLSRL